MTIKNQIKAVQKTLNLSVDGVAGKNTWGAIYKHLVKAPQTPAETSKPKSGQPTSKHTKGAVWAASFVSTAIKELGVEEVNGTNSGKRVEEYQAATWLDGTGWPWCAAFVCWCFREVGDPPSLDGSRPQTAAAWGFEKWATKNGLTLVKPFKPSLGVKAGDIVMYKFSHIGIAAQDSSWGYVKVVEGNTNSAGSREGGGVFLKKRKLSQIRSVVRLG